MRGSDLLQHSARIVEGKELEYGTTYKNMEEFATRISFHLGIPVTAQQAVCILLELKMSRLSHDSDHLDSRLDLAGYVAVLQEVINHQA